MNDEYEIVSVEEAGIDITVPAAPDVDDETDDESYEAAIRSHLQQPGMNIAAEDEDEEPETARANRAMIRRARRAARKHGAGWTRPFRKGRMPENQADMPTPEEHDDGKV